MKMETYENENENATKEERTATLESLGLRLTATFVPWSRSRNAGEKERSLNWCVKLFRDDRKIIETDYMQGIGHAPSYQFRPTRPPSLLDVCHSLGLDAQAGSASFEEFCADFGYDTDSRKARKTWKACRKTAYKLGRELTESINRICEGY